MSVSYETSSSSCSLHVKQRLSTSGAISIPRSNSSSQFTEYEMECDNFDPDNFTPPNEWTERLHQRLGLSINPSKVSFINSNK